MPSAKILQAEMFEHAKVEGLVLENCELKAQLADANRMIESRIRSESERDRFFAWASMEQSE